MEFINKLSNYLKLVTGYVLLIVGWLGFFLDHKVSEYLVNTPVTEKYILPTLFIITGIIILLIKEKSYQGGFFTYIGIFLCFLAAFGVSSEIELYIYKNEYSTAPAVNLLISLLFLYFGHKKHLTKWSSGTNNP